jgi:hypothetical protein
MHSHHHHTTDRSASIRQRIRGLLLTAAACLASLSGGCAAFTNPVADGIPVRLVPLELLAESREAKEDIPLEFLGQPPPAVYRLAPGDVLGIWIEGVLGERVPPPVQNPERTKYPPGVGYPIPVREDGTLPLPLLTTPINVNGLTLAEAEEAIRKAYTKEILPPGRERILLTLVRPREYHILVIRQDAGGVALGELGILSNVKRGTGKVSVLPAYENDVLHALAETGGFPGLDALDEVIIERAPRPGRPPAPRVMPPKRGARQAGEACEAGDLDGRFVRIPLRLRPGEPIPFKPEDVILYTGDTMFIEDRATEVFYTAGLLPSLQLPLPRDYDVDVIAAIALAHGPLINGGINANNLSGSLITSRIGTPSPSLLTVVRRTPGGGNVNIRVDLNRALQDRRESLLVKPGDVLILQETPGEALTRYITQTVMFEAFFQIFHSQHTSGTTTIALP